EKLDPRTMTAGDAQTLAALPPERWRARVDGLGPLLSAELARRAGLHVGEAPGERWEQTWAALQSLVTDPTVSEGLMEGGARE
ncbi:UNVERIFIED_CONTAM: hypothetical protein NY603_36240, partial [Bacteroidetes bacterium 56_B9]